MITQIDPAKLVNILVINMSCEDTVYMVFRGSAEAAMEEAKLILGEDEIDNMAVIPDQPIMEINGYNA